MSDAGDTDVPRRLVRAEQVLAARTRHVAVVLESSQDPRNVHAVLRTAEALGVQDVHLIAPRGEASAISPGVTQRAHEWLTLRRHATIDDAAVVLRAEGRVLVATANDEESEALTGFHSDARVAILLGNETEGLSARARELADRSLRIDLVGFSGSVNMSVAAAIVLWELRRLAVASSRAGDVEGAAAAELRADWYPRLFGSRPSAATIARHWLERQAAVQEAAARAPRIIPSSRDRGDAQGESGGEGGPSA